MRRIFTVGETVFDIIFRTDSASTGMPQPVSALPGGSMLNTAVSLGRLKQEVSLLSEYGKDTAGDLIEDFLNRNGVSTAFISRYSDGKSPLALAFLDSGNEASYSFYKIYPEKRLTGEMPRFRDNDIVAFGSFFALSPEVRPFLMKILESARASGCCMLYDPNFREAHLHGLPELLPLIEENISFADIVRASDQDLRNIYGAENHHDAYEKLSLKEKQILVYTAAARGVHVISNNFEIQVPAAPIIPVSTIGAGDSFNAGIIYSLIKKDIGRKEIRDITDDTWGRIIRTAVRFATHVCLSSENYISWEFADDADAD
jgi:fructokinase